MSYVGFLLLTAHLSSKWMDPVFSPQREKVVVVYLEEVLQGSASVLLRLSLPPHDAEGAIYYFELYKKDVPRPPCIDLDRAILGFNIDNSAAFQAIEDSKALHARRWQTKEGTYRMQRRALPDVRDAPLQDDNAAASCSDGKLRWRCWDGDYAMGYQHHP